MTTANADIITAWNTVLFDKFVRFQHVLTHGLSKHGELALEFARPRPGSRVVDIGCGFGDATAQIARIVGDGGKAVGIDCSKNFVEAAGRETQRDGVRNVEFLAADVQSQDLGGPYDEAFSRFGTMFFSSPVAALKNIRTSLKRGAPLTMVVWRKREENPWLYAAEQCVRNIIPKTEEEAGVTCGPGPFSMASPDVLSAQLSAAGFRRIQFERLDLDICIGRDIDEAIAFAMALGPAGEILRLAGEYGARKRPQVEAALAETFEAFARSDGYWAPSSTWVVRAMA